MNTEEKKISELLKEYADSRNMNTAKLAETSGVPERYITALVGGEFASLPPAPYVRGYLFKMAAALEARGEELWQSYKREVSPQSSGPLDRMPSNRFVIQSLSRKWVAIAGVVLILGTYLVFQLPAILGEPSLELAGYSEDKTYNMASSVLVLRGQVKPGDKVTLNNEAVYANAEGNFEKEILLQKGLNTVELTVSRFLGREKKMVRQFNYVAAADQSIHATPPNF